MKSKKFRKDWPLGFLSLLSIKGFIGVIQGNILESIWIVWLVWLIYLVPIKK